MVRKTLTSITNVLTKKQTEIMSIATMLMVVGLITKFFGFLFSAVSVGYLGTGPYQSYSLAANLPELITQVLLIGSLSASILPVLSQVLTEKGQQHFMRVFSTLVNVSLIVFSVAAALIAIFAPHVLPWFIEVIIKPETPPSAAEIADIANMMRLLLIPQVILGISIYFSTALNLYDRFLVPQLAPLFYNFGRILSIYIFIPVLGQSPWVLVWGNLLGAIIHLLIQLPLVWHLGIKILPVIQIRDFYIKKLAVLTVPRLLAISVEEIGRSIDRFIAFGLVGQSLALYNLSILIISIPLSLFGTSFATASFPTLSKAFNQHNRVLAGQVFIKILNQILFFSIPVSALLFILRLPISRLAYGIFGNQIGFLETYTIAWTILFFAPGLIFESTRSFLYRTFYATHDTVRPLVISLVVLALGAVSGVLFTNYLSHFNTFAINGLTFDLSFFGSRENGVSAVAGLALSSSLVFTLEALILILWINSKYLHLKLRDYVIPIGKKLIAAAAMIFVCWGIYRIWGDLSINERTLYLIILSATTSIAAIMIYFAACWFLKVEEVNVYMKFFLKYPNKQMIKKFVRFNPGAEAIAEEIESVRN